MDREAQQRKLVGLVDLALRAEGPEADAALAKARALAAQHGLTIGGHDRTAADSLSEAWLRDLFDPQRLAAERERQAALQAQREAEQARRRMERGWKTTAPITLADASAWSGVPVSTLRSAIVRGAMGGAKRGRDWATSRWSVHLYLQQSHGKRGRASPRYGSRSTEVSDRP